MTGPEKFGGRPESQSWFAELPPDEQQVWVAALGELLGRRLDEEKSDRGAALREKDRRMATAWQANPEFGDALHVALAIGRSNPFANTLPRASQSLRTPSSSEMGPNRICRL
jgi:hypothetical protein